MSEIHAKPVVDGKYWIVEQDGTKIATLQKKENNKFVLSSETGDFMFNKKEDLTQQFGQNFFLNSQKIKLSKAVPKEVHGYPTSCRPYNPMYDIRKKLPLFTKSNQSKSLYCAGYYIIKFEKGWVKSFCPKVITIERYPYQGPFLNEQEMRISLTNAKSN